MDVLQNMSYRMQAIAPMSDLLFDIYCYLCYTGPTFTRLASALETAYSLKNEWDRFIEPVGYATSRKQA
jgi:uncharacterized membrane protein